jgi:transposase
MNETPVQATLFPSSPAAAEAGPSCAVAAERGLRLRRADRAQLSWGRIDLEAALPEDHPARAIHAMIAKLDLRGLYGPIRARGETAGAPAIAPQILLALWVYATSEGVGSGREIARLVELHAAYRWLAADVELNDFRGQQGEVFDQLVTQVLARMLKHDLIDLHRVAQDGTRVRASAGAGSFRRGETLEALMAQAKEHLVT